MLRQASTCLRGLPRYLFFVPSPVRRNVIAASSLIFSPATGASKATSSKFAISSHRARNPQNHGANQRATPLDQTAHYRNYAHGTGFLRDRPPARKRKDSFDPARAFLGKRLDALSSSARRHPGVFSHAISRREAAHRRPRLHARLPEIFRAGRDRDRLLSSPHRTPPLFVFA